ncbi:MAG: hypothetical protein KDC95_23975, partial [Planctomycetes bacterium]|nr:hypothetical protein [Planctomycetota bacterium]
KSYDTSRGADGTYGKVSGTFTTDSYNCEENGIEERVDRRDARRYGNYIDAEMIAAMRTRDIVLKNHNSRVITLALGVATTTGAGTVWSTTATATPIANVRAAKIAIRNRCGAMANAMCLDWEAWEYLRNCSEIIERLKYSGLDDPKQASLNAVASVLGLEEIIISGAVTDGAAAPLAASVASMWDRTKALVFVKSTTQDTRKPHFMRTFHWGADGSQIGGAFESYYDPARRSDILRHRMDTDEKVLYADVAQVITDVLS